MLVGLGQLDTVWSCLGKGSLSRGMTSIKSAWGAKSVRQRLVKDWVGGSCPGVGPPLGRWSWVERKQAEPAVLCKLESSHHQLGTRDSSNLPTSPCQTGTTEAPGLLEWVTTDTIVELLQLLRPYPQGWWLQGSQSPRWDSTVVTILKLA